ncbi:DNA polymerase LigD [Lederbergia citrisecunda]|uniref:ATP-dependent DNA ligase n=1 Tax=Lederbergia citrisecunda TaxID=2833583 RepID=UPI003D2AF794
MLNKPIKPMLLQPDKNIPDSSNYIHQLKLDGHRALLHYDNGSIKLYTRHGNDVTKRYIELQNIDLPVHNCILDGELVSFEVVDDAPKPSFDNLMLRFQTTNTSKIQELVNIHPVHFAAFDIIYINDEAVTSKPLSERIDILNSVVSNAPYISLCASYSDGSELFETIKDLELEGIVTKNLNKPYTLNSRPADTFIKIKNYQYDIVKINGIRKDKFGWLMLDGDDQYKGVLEFVPSAERKAFYQISKQLVTGEDKNYIYLDPLIKCEVKYQCLSKKGYMRSASFKRFIV